MHFADEDVLRVDVVNIGGTKHILPRNRCHLRKGVIPRKTNRVDINNVILQEPSTSCEVSGVVEDNVKSAQVDVEETEMLHCDQVEIPHILTTRTLKSYLLEKPLLKMWAWTTSPGSEDEIVLLQVHPLSLEVRLRMHVNKDLSATIRTSNGIGKLKIDHDITTIHKLEELIKVAEAANVCTGRGIRTKSRSKNCSTITDGSRQRVKTARCKHCQKVRNLHFNNIRRHSSDMKSRYARSKQKARIHIRRYERQLKKTQQLQSAITDAKAACAAIKEETLWQQISALPELQQYAVKTIFKAAQVTINHGRRYEVDWVYGCLLMRIKNSKL